MACSVGPRRRQRLGWFRRRRDRCVPAGRRGADADVRRVGRRRGRRRRDRIDVERLRRGRRRRTRRLDFGSSIGRLSKPKTASQQQAQEGEAGNGAGKSVHGELISGLKHIKSVEKHGPQGIRVTRPAKARIYMIEKL